MRPEVADVLSKIIDSEDTTVGGGSASALSGAMAGGMIAMVAKLSRKKPVNFSVEQYDAIAAECDALAEKLQQGCVNDTQAYCMIVDAFKLPKGTEAEKAARSEARRQITLILRNGGTVPDDLWQQSGYNAVTIAAMLRGRKG